MKIEDMDFECNWNKVKKTALFTMRKKMKNPPDHVWKTRILLAEHSPIRKLKISWIWRELPYWVCTHFTRHKFGIEPFQQSTRSEVVKTDRGKIPQGDLIALEYNTNAQSLINVSRKRLCYHTSKETREAWELAKKKIGEKEPELARCMVKECIYRGFCPEMECCGYCHGEEYETERYNYVHMVDIAREEQEKTETK